MYFSSSVVHNPMLLLLNMLSVLFIKEFVPVIALSVLPTTHIYLSSPYLQQVPDMNG